MFLVFWELVVGFAYLRIDDRHALHHSACTTLGILTPSARISGYGKHPYFQNVVAANTSPEVEMAWGFTDVFSNNLKELFTLHNKDTSNFKYEKNVTVTKIITLSFACIRKLRATRCYKCHNINFYGTPIITTWWLSGYHV